MRSHKARWFRIVGMVLLVTIACGLPEISLPGFGNDDQPAADSQPENVSNDDRLGEVYISWEGGYSFQPVAGYTLEEFYGLVTMTAPGADLDVGPIITLIGGINEEEKTSEDLVDDLVQGMPEGIKVSKAKKIKIGGRSGLTVSFEGTNNGAEIAGEAFLAAVTPTQMFSLVGFFPANEFGRKEESLLQAVVDTVEFFKAQSENVAAAEGGVLPAGGSIRQWASTATAGSEYGNPDWAADQATGAPDTLDCGDHETAWASEGNFSIDWLEVGFAQPVVPAEINIYESHTPSQVIKVEVRDDTGSYHEVYTAVPVAMSACPYVLNIVLQNANYQAVAVRITVDQTQLGLPWDEIDAVELVGASSTQAAQPPAADNEEQPPKLPAPDSPGSPGDASWTWRDYTTADGLPDDTVQALAFSPDGTLWIGMKEGGVAQLAGGNFHNFTVDDGLGSNNVKDIVITADGVVWAGTAAGLSRYDGKQWVTLTTKDGLVHNIVNGLALTGKNNLWIATEAGISYYDQTTWTNYTPDGGSGRTNVKDVAIAGNGDVWFATFNGVSRFNGSEWAYYNIGDGLSLDVYKAVGAGPDGSVWLGSSGEAADRYDGSQWTSYKADMGPTVYIAAIVADKTGIMWFGTEGDGVYRYDGQTWQQFLTDNSGLTYNWVDAAVAGPDGEMWFAARKNGIVRFGP